MNNNKLSSAEGCDQMRPILNPRQQKRQKDSRSPKPVGIDGAPDPAKRLALRLSFCRFCLEGFQRPIVLTTPDSIA